MDRLTKIVNDIEDYTKRHAELKKSHHFLFNCPLDDKTKKADVVVIGLNPGECDNDYYKCKTNLPTQETHVHDFHEAHEKGSREKIHWTKKCKKYLEGASIFQSEFFFWSSHNIGKGFSDRFGYKFRDCPHFEFCRDCNLELMRYHRPKLIVATGTKFIDTFKDLYDLKHIKTITHPNGKRKANTRIICHYEWEGIPFIFTPHWTGAHMETRNKEKMLKYLRQYI